MSTIRQRSTINTISGSLLRLGGGRAIAIYLRKGAVSVADFTGGPCRISGIAEWHCFNGRKLAQAQRRGEVEISDIPDDVADRIEHVHRRMEEAQPYYSVLMPAVETTLLQRAISSLR